MLAASIAPSAAPAPTIVCNSSMKIMISPAPLISAMILVRRSSNSPRYLVPAIIEDRSRVTTLLPARISGTRFSMMRCARPSTIAVLPTPGSPIKTGLFLVRRDNTCMTRSISRLRPITGSRRPSLASWVKSRLKASRVGVLLLPFLLTCGGAGLGGCSLKACPP